MVGDLELHKNADHEKIFLPRQLRARDIVRIASQPRCLHLCQISSTHSKASITDSGRSFDVK